MHQKVTAHRRSIGKHSAAAPRISENRKLRLQVNTVILVRGNTARKEKSKERKSDCRRKQYVTLDWTHWWGIVIEIEIR